MSTTASLKRAATTISIGLAAVVIAAADYLIVNPVDGHTTPHAATAKPPGKKHI